MIFDLFASEDPARVLDCCTGIGFSHLLTDWNLSRIFYFDLFTSIQQYPDKGLKLPASTGHQQAQPPLCCN